jgi:hypothetical protein
MGKLMINHFGATKELLVAPFLGTTLWWLP